MLREVPAIIRAVHGVGHVDAFQVFYVVVDLDSLPAAEGFVSQRLTAVVTFRPLAAVAAMNMDIDVSRAGLNRR